VTETVNPSDTTAKAHGVQKIKNYKKSVGNKEPS